MAPLTSSTEAPHRAPRNPPGKGGGSETTRTGAAQADRRTTRIKETPSQRMTCLRSIGGSFPSWANDFFGVPRLFYQKRNPLGNKIEDPGIGRGVCGLIRHLPFPDQPTTVATWLAALSVSLQFEGF